MKLVYTKLMLFKCPSIRGVIKFNKQEINLKTVSNYIHKVDKKWVLKGGH